MFQPPQRHAILGGRRDTSWDRFFTVRRATKFHGRAFDKRLFEDSEPRNTAQLVQRLLASEDVLDPQGPSHVFLRKFLLTADYGVLTNSRSSRVHQLTKLAIFDDRRERDTFQDALRNWGDPKYLRGPTGVNVVFGAVDERQLHERLKQKREHNFAERRILFVANPTTLCLIAMTDTIPRSFRSNFRDYMERYLTKRALFQITKIGTALFVMEFHIPYLALRDKGSAQDDRIGPAGRLRRSRYLPVRQIGEDPDAAYHEAQISFLLFGPDEWFWTAYCFVDTYFGSETSTEEYINAVSGAPANANEPGDPLTGGDKLLRTPIWNPREYFLVVLARRIEQVSKEWSSLVAAMNDRLTAYLSTYDTDIVKGRFFDDLGFSGTFRSTRAVSVLRDFREVLSDTLYGWDTFASLEPECFVCEYPAVNENWLGYISQINDSVAHLRFLERSLEQKIQLFDRIKDDLMSRSALKENREATSQGEKISVLTYATVIYLPFTFSAGVLSMSMVPLDFSWKWFLATSLTLCAITFPLAFFYEELKTLVLYVRARLGI